MRNGVEGNLAAEGRGVVASKFGDESMGRLVTGGLEKKNDIINEPQGEELGR